MLYTYSIYKQINNPQTINQNRIIRNQSISQKKKNKINKRKEKKSADCIYFLFFVLFSSIIFLFSFSFFLFCWIQYIIIPEKRNHRACVFFCQICIYPMYITSIWKMPTFVLYRLWSHSSHIPNKWNNKKKKKCWNIFLL